MNEPLPIGVLVSGRGTNLQAIIDAIENKSLNASIKVVISNNPLSYAIERARRYGIPVEVIPDRDYPNKEEYDKRLIEILKERKVKLVVLAGFMRILTPTFVKTFPMRIMNIHPALLPSFPGLHVQKKALEYGVRFSGCTVHFVDEGVDTGPIIIQAVVPVYDNDTEEELSERILKQEHRIYPQAIQLFAEGRLEIKGRKVIIKGYKKPVEDVIINPPVEEC